MTVQRTIRVAVTGAHGQLARAVLERGCAESGFEMISMARPEFDLSRPASISEQIALANPDILINTAAWTAVDDAEAREAEVYAVNEIGAGAVSAGASAIGIPVLHLSTDYVFSGDKLTAYVETDPAAPRSVYGRSKLAGERAVMAANARAIILRTSWVYAYGAKNFVSTMMRLATQRSRIGVVDDQCGRPTYAPHIASGLLDIARRVAGAGWDAQYCGVFHVAGADSMSWRRFAEAIFAMSKSFGYVSAAVDPISTADYPTAAARPANSDLDCSKLKRVFGIEMPGVEAGLNDYFARLSAIGRTSTQDSE